MRVYTVDRKNKIIGVRLVPESPEDSEQLTRQKHQIAKIFKVGYVVYER